jgi:hypothetical protein
VWTSPPKQWAAKRIHGVTAKKWQGPQGDRTSAYDSGCESGCCVIVVKRRGGDKREKEIEVKDLRREVRYDERRKWTS